MTLQEDGLKPKIRYFYVAGKRTSALLEDVFWDGLRAMAAVRGTDVSAEVERLLTLHADLLCGGKGKRMSFLLRVVVAQFWRERAVAACAVQAVAAAAEDRSVA